MMANVLILIRHPKKMGDEEGIYLGDLAEITQEGEQELPLVTARLKLIGPTALICSMFPRAYTLAKYIATELGLGLPIQLRQLNEIDKPQFLRGRKRRGRLHTRVMRTIRRLWNANKVPTELLRGEKIRTRKEVERDIKYLFRFVENFSLPHGDPETDIVCAVSHAKTIAAIVHWVYRGDGTLLDYYEQADRALKVNTTGITILRREPNRRTGKIEWVIDTTNERSHTEIGHDEELRSLIKDI